MITQKLFLSAPVVSRLNPAVSGEDKVGCVLRWLPGSTRAHQALGCVRVGAGHKVARTRRRTQSLWLVTPCPGEAQSKATHGGATGGCLGMDTALLSRPQAKLLPPVQVPGAAQGLPVLCQESPAAGDASALGSPSEVIRVGADLLHCGHAAGEIRAAFVSGRLLVLIPAVPAPGAQAGL